MMLRLNNDKEEILINPNSIIMVTKDFIHVRCIGNSGEDVCIDICQATYDVLCRVLVTTNVDAKGSKLTML